MGRIGQIGPVGRGSTQPPDHCRTPETRKLNPGTRSGDPHVLALRSESSTGEDVQAVRRGEAPHGVPPRLPPRPAQGHLQGLRVREGPADLLGGPREAPCAHAGQLSRRPGGVAREEATAGTCAAAAPRSCGEQSRGAAALAPGASRGDAGAHAPRAATASPQAPGAPRIVGAAQAGAARCGRPMRGLRERERGAASPGLQRSLPRGAVVSGVSYAAPLRRVAARGRRADEVSRGVWGLRVPGSRFRGTERTA